MKCLCCGRTKEDHDAPKFTLECRDKSGALLLRDENDKPVLQPPNSPSGDLYWTERELYDYWFEHNPDGGASVSQEAVRAWFAERNWYWRPKTW